MKKMMICLLALLFVGCMTGCQGKEMDIEILPNVDQEKETINFKYPEGFNNLVEIFEGDVNAQNGMLHDAGYYFSNVDGQLVIVICMGEQSTGGYAIEAISAYQQNGEYIIVVQQTSPSENQAVTCAFTYPYCSVRIIDQGMKDNLSKIKIVDTTGREFVSLAAKN